MYKGLTIRPPFFEVGPNLIVAEPTDLIGTGQTSDENYVTETIRTVRAAAAVDCLAIDTQCETLILTDENGTPYGMPSCGWTTAPPRKRI